MYKYRRVVVAVIAVVLALLMVGGLVFSAFAESSSTIKSRIDALKREEAAIAAQQQEIQEQREANESEIMDLVSQKNGIDQQIKLTQDSIENKNQQIQEYSLLIAAKQDELDDALEQRDALNARYKVRIRSMEEKGKLTYWSILFKASSFADLLDRVEMINEIARADARMIDQLQEAAQGIEATRQELAAEKIELEEAKEALSAAEAELETKREESDQVMAELMEDHEVFAAAEAEYESEKESLLAQIAQQETKYQQAVAAEEKARREAAAAAAARENGASGGGSSSSSGAYSSTVSRYGFQWPCTARGITCRFGPRVHPITGAYSNHSGMDIGASYGSPIYACASGTVTTATFGTAYGNYVTINHGNGFSTLYGHMTRYTVRAGQYVTRGEIIGYVGSTGWSTGPHLHLTMYYNGSLVDPLNYLPAGGYFT